MPQLDIAIFFNQFFWFFGLFICLYYFFSYVVIPKVNFYYFVRYNINQAIVNFEKSFSLVTLSKELDFQTTEELNIIRSNSWAQFSFKLNYVMTASMVPNTTYLVFEKLSELNSCFLDYFLCKFFENHNKIL